jgi:hypothetical protein
VPPALPWALAEAGVRVAMASTAIAIQWRKHGVTHPGASCLIGARAKFGVIRFLVCEMR